VDSSLANVVYVLAGAAVANQKADAKIWTAEEMFNEVHGGRKLHFGARRTWLALNRRFPGHKIAFKWIAERIEKYALCQKDRLGMDNYLEPIYRHIKPSYSRKAVGVDRLTVTPADEQGNTCLIVVVVFFTKYVSGQRPPRNTTLQLRHQPSSHFSVPLVRLMSYGPTLVLILRLR